MIYSRNEIICIEDNSEKFGVDIIESFEEGYEFDAVVLDDSLLPHPQILNLAERMERAVYLGLDEKNITAKFVAGSQII